MDITRAVELLNDRKHNGGDTWQHYPQFGFVRSNLCDDGNIYALFNDEAIAIAKAYEQGERGDSFIDKVEFAMIKLDEVAGINGVENQVRKAIDDIWTIIEDERMALDYLERGDISS